MHAKHAPSAAERVPDHPKSSGSCVRRVRDGMQRFLLPDEPLEAFDAISRSIETPAGGRARRNPPLPGLRCGLAVCDCLVATARTFRIAACLISEGKCAVLTAILLSIDCGADSIRQPAAGACSCGTCWLTQPHPIAFNQSQSIGSQSIAADGTAGAGRWLDAGGW